LAQSLNQPAKTDAILARLGALYPVLIDLSLDRIQRLLARLGDPQHRLPPVVHVAGTNGKGSLIAYLRAMLEAAGYRVHVYTSPHLVRFNERIRLAGELIGDEHLLHLLQRVEAANAGEPITLFEVITAACLLACTETPADVVLLETGLGGTYDATNVIARPALTAITPIAFDHMDFLGDSIAAIAGEKAGILKRGVPAVIGPQEADAAAVLAARAAELHAPLFRQGKDWQAEIASEQMLWTAGGETMRLPLPALPGAHQVANAATAIACLRRLPKFTVPEAAIAEGLRKVEWPARLQRLQHGPLVDLLPPWAELWLDGGHNPHCAAAVAATLRNWRAAEPVARPLQLIVAMKSNKDLPGFLAPFVGLADAVTGLAIPGDPNCFAPEAVATAAAALGIPATAAGSAAEAIAAIRGETLAAPPRLLICGSLYLAGAILAENG